MILYPDAQKKAQAEIDAVVGRGRLPAPTDRPSLPYLEAVLREVIRWHPIFPICKLGVVLFFFRQARDARLLNGTNSSSSCYD
jgi:cytochrome P450